MEKKAKCLVFYGGESGVKAVNRGSLATAFPSSHLFTNSTVIWAGGRADLTLWYPRDTKYKPYHCPAALPLRGNYQSGGEYYAI